MLERDEELLWDFADGLELEDGALWIHDLDDDSAVMGFTDFSLANLRKIISNHIDRRSQSSAPKPAVLAGCVH